MQFLRDGSKDDFYIKPNSRDINYLNCDDIQEKHEIEEEFAQLIEC